jgi:hypothetical protein
LCNKYYLRFLPTAIYKGSIDKETANKISQFEIANGVKCGNWERRVKLRGYEWQNGNTYIVAPKESFELQEKPKDPLLFYQINNEYFYLIHKWGNDISTLRRTYGLLSSVFISWLVFAIPMGAIVSFFIYKKVQDPGGVYEVGIIFGSLLFFSVSLWLIINQFRIMHENNWRSHYID